MTYTRTTIALMADNASDHDPVVFPKEVLDLSRVDWSEIATALDFYRTQQSLNSEERKYFRELERDIRSSILDHLPEEVA